MHKNYALWTPIKIKTNTNLDRPPKFCAGQVWDCIVGENIGVESDGKNNSFIRPVRTWDASRLVRRIDKVEKRIFSTICQALREYLGL